MEKQYEQEEYEKSFISYNALYLSNIIIKKEKKDSLLACYLFFVYLCVIIISVT